MKKFLFFLPLCFLLIACSTPTKNLSVEEITQEISTDTLNSDPLWEDDSESKENFNQPMHLVSFELDTDEKHNPRELSQWIGGEVYLTDTVPEDMEFYRIIWKGEGDYTKKFSNYPTYTNDPSWLIDSLQFTEIEKDVSTYQWFFWDDIWQPWRDSKNLFLGYRDEAISIETLPNYIPLQTLWTQSFDGLVGYSDGYLLLFPFKFPVDKDSFQTVQVKRLNQPWLRDDIPDLREISGWLRRPRFINDGTVYYRYLWDDKDWVYMWIGVGNTIARMSKTADFKFLPMQEWENPNLMMIDGKMVVY